LSQFEIIVGWIKTWLVAMEVKGTIPSSCDNLFMSPWVEIDLHGLTMALNVKKIELKIHLIYFMF
jgi:hypothetical protein